MKTKAKTRQSDIMRTNRYLARWLIQGEEKDGDDLYGHSELQYDAGANLIYRTFRLSEMNAVKAEWWNLSDEKLEDVWVSLRLLAYRTLCEYALQSRKRWTWKDYRGLSYWVQYMVPYEEFARWRVDVYRSFRERLRVSVGVVAEGAQLSEETLTKIEAGKKLPNSKTLDRIESALEEIEKAHKRKPRRKSKAK